MYRLENLYKNFEKMETGIISKFLAISTFYLVGLVIFLMVNLTIVCLFLRHLSIQTLQF
nr:MAG TPA: hypothetical protein [Caudoviricetes sp.]